MPHLITPSDTLLGIGGIRDISEISGRQHIHLFLSLRIQLHDIVWFVVESFEMSDEVTDCVNIVYISKIHVEYEALQKLYLLKVRCLF